jgi:hypothetical protein
MQQKPRDNTKSSFDGLTAKDWAQMFNSEAEKSGLSTRATVEEAPTTTPTISVTLRKDSPNEPNKQNG